MVCTVPLVAATLLTRVHARNPLRAGFRGLYIPLEPGLELVIECVKSTRSGIVLELDHEYGQVLERVLNEFTYMVLGGRGIGLKVKVLHGEFLKLCNDLSAITSLLVGIGYTLCQYLGLSYISLLQFIHELELRYEVGYGFVNCLLTLSPTIVHVPGAPSFALFDVFPVPDGMYVIYIPNCLELPVPEDGKVLSYFKKLVLKPCLSTLGEVARRYVVEVPRLTPPASAIVAELRSCNFVYPLPTPRSLMILVHGKKLNEVLDMVSEIRDRYCLKLPEILVFRVVAGGVVVYEVQ
ncbi:MAG: hypothetical protein DRJ40_07420 [Thermoprotei archaeon]|nr:MAG: hypothetical protein DRJ40_07420 [Thermoprotei archaeon]